MEVTPKNKTDTQRSLLGSAIYSKAVGLFSGLKTAESLLASRVETKSTSPTFVFWFLRQKMGTNHKLWFSHRPESHSRMQMCPPESHSF